MVVIFVLQEGIVTLAISSSHLHLSNSSTVGHVADHT